MTVSIDPALVTLAERLIATKRHDRNDVLRHGLRLRESEAAKRGTLGAGFYARAQQDACVVELNERVDAIWSAYRRVLADARVAWSPAVREAVVERISVEVEADIGYVEDMARDVISPHGHSFDLFLRKAWPDILARISAEVDLFGLKQRALPTLLGDQLSAPRYAGPAVHWTRTQDALSSDDPDFVAAAREAIHTVEGLAKVIVGLPSGTLGDSIKVLKDSGRLPSPVARQMEILWGYSSNLETLRHGSATGELPDVSVLQFIVESAEVNAKYLLRLDATAS